MRVHITLIALIPWRKHLDLPNMCISSTMLILNDAYLHEHSLYIRLQNLPILPFLLKLESEPANGLFEIDQLHFLQLIEGITHFYRNLLRSVRLISLKVQV